MILWYAIVFKKYFTCTHFLTLVHSETVKIILKVESSKHILSNLSNIIRKLFLKLKIVNISELVSRTLLETEEVFQPSICKRRSRK